LAKANPKGIQGTDDLPELDLRQLANSQQLAG
jgi:hypothetical protein